MTVKMSLTLTGLEALEAEFLRLADFPQYNLNQIIKKVARLYYDRVLDNIRNSVPVGKVYHRVSGIHRASAPGQPPAIETGSFISSIYIRKTGGGYVVGSTDDRGRLFETGGITTSGNYIAARPWLESVWPEIQDEVAILVDMELKRYGR